MIAEILKLYTMGFSYRKIAKLLGISKSEVQRVIKNKKEKTNKGRKSQPLPFVDKSLKEKIKILLEHKTEEKGKTRNISFLKVYEALEIEFKQIGINNKTKFYRFIHNFIHQEYGSLEALLLKRANKKEVNKLRKNEGYIRRERIIEIDATGYTYKGVRYAILQAMDQYSGYLLDFMIIKSKEDKDVYYYNKAFNQIDFMYFLYNLFKRYGIADVKVDNEKFLITSNIERALNELGVRLIRAKAYNPREKLIERAFRTVKEEIRVLTALSNADFEELWETAINKYNKTKHNFTAGSWIPAERFETYEYIDEDKIREAFAYEEERTWINGYIKFDNKTYFFQHPLLENMQTSLGRKRENPKVKIRIDLENNTRAYVYFREEYLGTATLITTVEHTSTIEEKESKQKARRIERTKRKLQTKLDQLSISKEQEEKEENNIDIFEEILNAPQTEEKIKGKKELVEEIPDLLDFFS